MFVCISLYLFPYYISLIRRSDSSSTNTVIKHVKRKTHQIRVGAGFCFCLQENKNVHLEEVKDIYTCIHLKKKGELPDKNYQVKIWPNGPTTR